MFFEGSRYRRTPEATLSDGQGRTLPLMALREPAATEVALVYTVREGDRLDLLAHKFVLDPRKWWLIADANPDVLTLEEMLVPGRPLRIPRDRNP